MISATPAREVHLQVQQMLQPAVVQVVLPEIMVLPRLAQRARTRTSTGTTRDGSALCSVDPLQVAVFIPDSFEITPLPGFVVTTMALPERPPRA